MHPLQACIESGGVQSAAPAAAAHTHRGRGVLGQRGALSGGGRGGGGGSFGRGGSGRRGGLCGGILGGLLCSQALAEHCLPQLHVQIALLLLQHTSN